MGIFRRMTTVLRALRPTAETAPETASAAALLPVKSIRYFAWKAGFRRQEQTTITAIALAESGGNPTARNTNVDGSVDRGLMQINNVWHPEVSDAQADDPLSAMFAAWRISARGTDFSPWSTYESGAYKQFLASAAGNPAVEPLQIVKTVLLRPFNGVVDVTQPFGPTSVQSEPMGYYLPDYAVCYDRGDGITAQRVHCGVDYAMSEGTELIAPADGVVALVGWSPTGFGNRTVIDHGDVLTLYGHQRDISVTQGQDVRRGETIGHSGSTGNSTGPHLHWSVIDGPIWRHYSRTIYLDPARYVYGW